MAKDPGTPQNLPYAVLSKKADQTWEWERFDYYGKSAGKSTKKHAKAEDAAFELATSYPEIGIVITPAE